MKKISEPIVFFGSGPVAAKSLLLLAKNFDVEAVVTKPRAAHHRGEVPVLTVADQLKLPVKTAVDKRELDQIFSNMPFESRVGVLIDFGIIVSQKVIEYFPFGIVNSHFSLLPQWRGADPIAFAILGGQKQTGVSLMLLVEAMDEGPIIIQGTYDIKPDDTTTSLTEQLIDLSAELLKTALPKYLFGDLTPKPQENDGKATYSRKLTKKDSVLDWRKPAEQLEREVRAFIDWPKSRAVFGRLEVIVTQSHALSITGEPGKASIVEKLPVVYCKSGALVLDRLKPAGKKEMAGEAFLAGYKNLFLTA